MTVVMSCAQPWAGAAMNELTLFDSPKVQQLAGPIHACTGSSCSVCHLDDPKAEGMRLAADAKALWNIAADLWLAEQWPGSFITADDLTAAIGLPAGQVEGKKNNAVGARFSAWNKARRIAYVQHVQSTRKSSHSSRISQWQVL